MILVTGPTGYVGRQVVEALISSGRPVRALVHMPSRASVLSAYDAEIVYGDVLDPESLRRACSGVEAVVHLVAIVREGSGMTFQRVNYEGTQNMPEAAASAGVECFIHPGFIGASSDASVPYLYSRWMAEQEVVRSPVSHTIVRFSIGFGEGSGSAKETSSSI